MATVVRLKGVNGVWFNLTDGNYETEGGTVLGPSGIYLATDVSGIFDPPVKAVYEEPGNFPGARYLNHRILRRDVVFGVEILNDEKDGPEHSWSRRDSMWRRAWSFSEDAELHITTDESGTRYLKLRLFESPSVEMAHDPNMNVINLTKMVTVAGDPFWYEDDVVYPAVTTLDTTFDPNPLPWPWPQEDLPTETLTITVPNANPTDQILWAKWTLPGSSLAPSEPYVPGLPWLGAPNSPATRWIVPDYKFELEPDDDPAMATRRIQMPDLIGGLRTEEVQKIYIDGRPTGGTFTLSYDGETTAPLAYNASTAAVESALIALAGISANDVDVTMDAATNEVQLLRLTGGSTGGTFTLTVNGETTAPIVFNPSDIGLKSAIQALPSVGQLDVAVSSERVNEVQTVRLVGEPTSGTFTLTFSGETTAPIPYNATAAQVESALRALNSIGNNDVRVEAGNDWFNSPYTITFGETGGIVGGIVDVIAGLVNNILDFLGPIGDWIEELTQNVASLIGIGDFLDGSPGLSGVNVRPLTGNASGLSGGAGLAIEVETVTEGDRVYTIEFKSGLAGVNMPLITGNTSGLTGGVSPTVEVATSRDGSRPYAVRFTSDLSGIDVPQMTIDTSALTGGSGVTGRVITTREGATAPAENVVVDTDPRVEQVSSESGSQIWARMNGVRFLNYIPPYTGEVTFEVTVSGAVPGQMITLRLPRAWSRPWGLE
ncbi:hypothetical protein [Mycolicibacterium houstonense]|uniref:hypothetical protein n=1 Tax=Mycolicibacterium houstonense TaxID=146021 RepID=UPI000831F358|nr:hypothetical protein [Mycolicibacterium houstonense]